MYDLVKAEREWRAISSAALSSCFRPCDGLPDCLAAGLEDRPPRLVGVVDAYFGRISVYEPVDEPPGGWDFLVACLVDLRGQWTVAYVSMDIVEDMLKTLSQKV